MNDECPYCHEPMFSIAAYEHHIKTEHSEKASRSGHKHRHDIPVEWEYGTAYGSIEQKRVLRLRCACGDEVARKGVDEVVKHG